MLERGLHVWVGEFGPVYTGDPGADAMRYQVLPDQLGVYDRYAASWASGSTRTSGCRGSPTPRPTPRGGTGRHRHHRAQPVGRGWRVGRTPRPHAGGRRCARVEVRGHGLLASAPARPRATVFGADAYAYATLEEKAAALLHSIAGNRALVDGNKRLALAATIAFLGVNGKRPAFSNDEAYDVIIAVAASELDDVARHCRPHQAGQ